MDLFSGIGGISLALKDWVRPLAYCEIDPYCQKVLLSRIADDSLHDAPIWDDIRTLKGRLFSEAIHIISGGFPCQDISVAGNGKGLDGERSGLFFEIVRLCRETKPRFIFLENVPAITTRGGSRVVREITALGYDCRWCIISAASVGALHRRERWFLLAHAVNDGTSSGENRGSTRERSLSGRQGKEKQAESFGTTERTSCIFGNVADTRCECERSENKPEWPSLHFTGCSRIWEVEPPVGRLADGIPDRVARLRALGNAVVPQQCRQAFKILMGLE
ncbi:MAG TPA: DNA (cytosine-5-)-methyltransferase [Nitrososphaeraceae archaeon]